MKIKWNWGTGIFIAIVLFMIFILQFVYRVTFMDEYDHHLVSDDYYKDELHYQEEINKENNALNLTENVKIIHRGSTGIDIQFPKDMNQDSIKGVVQFKRLSNEKLDFIKPIVLKDHTLYIPGEEIVNGKWIIYIDWQYKKDNYLLKETFFY